MNMKGRGRRDVLRNRPAVKAFRLEMKARIVACAIALMLPACGRTAPAAKTQPTPSASSQTAAPMVSPSSPVSPWLGETQLSMLPGGKGCLGVVAGNKTWLRGWLFRTSDGGRSWGRITLDGLRSVTYLQAFDPAGAVVIDAAGGTLHTTEDGGAHWQHQSFPSPVPTGRTPAYFTSPSEGWVIISSATSGTSSLYHTANAGRSWDVAVPELSGQPVVHFRDSRTGWVSHPGRSGPEVFETSDGGRTWDAITLATPPTYPGLVTLVGPVLTFGTSAAVTLYVHVAEGSQGAGSPASIYAYSSSDAGRHWSNPVTVWSGKAMESAPPALPSLASPSIWYTLLTDTVRLSRDGGRSWKSYPLGSAPAYSPYSAAFPTDAEGYVMLQQQATRPDLCLRGCVRLMRTIDGGGKWEMVSFPELPADLIHG